MGNCLKSPTSDDISLLHESQSDRASYGDGAEPDQEPPPPYQVGHPDQPATLANNVTLATVLVCSLAKVQHAKERGACSWLPK